MEEVKALSGASVESRLRRVEERIAAACQRAGRELSDITLVAVAKEVEAKAIMEACAAGIRHFGENRVQEAQRKRELLTELKPPPTWHMVGHLQTNKVKSALELFDIIHSIDSLHLAEVVSQRASHPVPVLLQVNVSSEAAKGGFSPEELPSVLQDVRGLANIEVEGLMTIAPLVRDPEEARPFFRQLRILRDKLGLRHLSMGMTDDFEVAIEEGATMVRIGRAIFGERPQE